MSTRYTIHRVIAIFDPPDPRHAPYRFVLKTIICHGNRSTSKKLVSIAADRSSRDGGNERHFRVRHFRSPDRRWGSSFRAYNRPAATRRTWCAPAGPRRTSRTCTPDRVWELLRLYVRVDNDCWLFRIDNRTVKPEQVFTEVGVNVKDSNKESLPTTDKVTTSLYQKLIVQDLTSTSKGV